MQKFVSKENPDRIIEAAFWDGSPEGIVPIRDWFHSSGTDQVDKYYDKGEDDTDLHSPAWYISTSGDADASVARFTAGSVIIKDKDDWFGGFFKESTFWEDYELYEEESYNSLIEQAEADKEMAEARPEFIPFSSADEGTDYPLVARRLLAFELNYKGTSVDIDDVYVITFSYILGNWKALLSTTIADGKIYEVTHNKEKGETYIDTYGKIDNTTYDAVENA